MSYLDTKKSVIISSPAGSGKTEKLARRYIALLQSGVKVERILAVTFTDKAAAEMKQRILKILKEEDTKLFDALIERMSLMRVSTIHSFCGTLLRRFSFEAGIDPNYRVDSAIESRISWEEIIYSLLMEAGAGKDGHELFLQTIGEKGFRGLAKLNDTLNSLYEKRPFSLETEIAPVEALPPELLRELSSWEGAEEAIEEYASLFKDENRKPLSEIKEHFLTTTGSPRKRIPGGLKSISEYKVWAEKMHQLWKQERAIKYFNSTLRIKDIFRRCIERYTQQKRSRALLDFSDLEHIAYMMLTEEPEWANILYAFDEKTDHILVDEFQDTNNFQWAMIDSLTEEWRSGIGSKRDEGIRPTIFLVGDVKQSIYLFRGANVEIFRRAKEKLSAWLGDEFHYEEAKENYRSAPAIIDLTNTIFSRIMSGGGASPAWVTEYGRFEPYRKEPEGSIELLIMDGDEEGIKAEKEKEADLIAKRISSLISRYETTDRKTGEKKKCRYMDIAILLRKRTHLKKYEEALRRHGIPFIAVKGIGFYQEPEIAMLRSLLYFLSNPKDDYSLYILLKSPLFLLDEGEVLKAINAEGGSLFDKLSGSPFDLLDQWLSRLHKIPLAELIEEALVETGAWRWFHEPQKHANIKKFIRLIEDLESEGKTPIKIRAFLESTINEGKEPKANVNTESMDAVKVMTIHASKGLEFPIVFIPGIEEPFNLKKDENLIHEKDGSFFLKSITDASIRKDDDDFKLLTQKEVEEQKRLFYVAVTRAEEALVMTARWKDKSKGFLDYLRKGLGLESGERGYSTAADLKGLSIVSENDVIKMYKSSEGHTPAKENIPHKADFIPLSARRRKEWSSVTEGLELKGGQTEDWIVPGEVIHSIFEEISAGNLKEEGISGRAEALLNDREISGRELQQCLGEISRTVTVLKDKSLWQSIVLPAEDSFTELPFVFESGNHIYKGKIDRIIKEGDIYNIYDYKTFPVKNEETGELVKQYSFQLNLYKKAIKKILDTEKVNSFVLFTYNGDVRQV